VTEYYVDSTTGNNADNGTTPALAWATIEYALESGGLSAGDNVWIRRLHSEIPTSDIAPAYDGAPNNPITVLGWTRATVTGTATFTNGSTSVSAVSITADREQHQARMIKCDADGEYYLITRVVDANTVTIDREYASTTAATSAFTIQADDDYSTRPQAGIDAGWDADAHDLPVIDFNDGAFQLYVDLDYYHVFKNLEFKDSADTNGIIYSNRTNAVSFIGCLIKQSANNSCLARMSAESTISMERVIFEGSGAGASQRGLYLSSVHRLHLKDCAIYNVGANGIHCYTGHSTVFFENVNVGVEIANGANDIKFNKGGAFYGRDVKLGGTNGYVAITAAAASSASVAFENYGKILGAHKSWYLGGTIEKAAVTGETPNKKLSDDVIKIAPSTSGYEFIPDWAVEVFSHEFEVDTTTRTWKYWIYNDAMGTINDTAAKDNVWLELEYIAVYSDTSEYTIKKMYSTEIDILNAANADDWDYLQVSGITPAVASKVRIKCFVSDYSAAGHIYIDPQVVNP
jgi:hypothetical protein